LKLSNSLIHHLKVKHIYSLAHISSSTVLNILAPQGWTSVEDLELVSDLTMEWNGFLVMLMESVISLNDAENIVVWYWNQYKGVVTVKDAYDALIS